MSENNDVANTTAEKHLAIKAKFNNKVDIREMSFFFKTVKILDSEGKDTGETSKRDTITLDLPVPSVEGIIHILESGDDKATQLLLEAVADIVAARARALINEDESLKADNFPLEQLAWEVIANLPKAERRGGGISKETWDEFVKDYIAVMPVVTGKTVQQVTNAAKLFAAKFNPVKTNKPVIAKLKEQLGIWLTNSKQAGDLTECYEFLVNKADKLLAADEAALLENL